MYFGRERIDEAGDELVSAIRQTFDHEPITQTDKLYWKFVKVIWQFPRRFIAPTIFLFLCSSFLKEV